MAITYNDWDYPTQSRYRRTISPRAAEKARLADQYKRLSNFTPDVYSHSYGRTNLSKNAANTSPLTGGADIPSVNEASIGDQLLQGAAEVADVGSTVADVADDALAKTPFNLKDWLAKHGFGWSLDDGLTAFKHNLKPWGIGVPAAFQAFDAIKNFENLDDNTAATEDLLADIRAAAANNRMLYYDLSPDQLALLRNVSAGNYDNEWDLSDLSISSMLGGGLTGALTGIAGGLPGMVVNGLAGVFNAGLEDISQGVAADNAELEALYQAIVASNQEYNDTRKQMAYNRMMR